ncbi:PspC domain-containing protein [Weissella bombi]|uniref:Phage shock protein C (PspC) family protein n=1 Tax=Weissella bombi TaxID=1505725 RepID=A0A1C4B7I2_9LACO|nr:PspC domain-containing protein [Weissella bombi]SCC02698.1 phage shock protein C (PspC) family protein [Weissella bombi]
MSKKNKLTKSNNRVLGGVLGGISDYLDLDTTLVRLLFVAATVFSGVFPLFIILYIVAAIIMPDAPRETHHTTYQFDEKSSGQRRDVTPDDDKEDDEL